MNPLPSIARARPRGRGARRRRSRSPRPLASADSIVYVKDANVWLASGDGGSQYQVTTDGTAAQPYRSPSQADDGTIAVVQRHRDPADAARTAASCSTGSTRRC